MTASPELLATCWTTAGDVVPSNPDQRSPLPITDRIAAVAAGGWDGIGIVYADLIEFQRHRPLGDLRRILDDHGIEHIEIELLENWWAEDERQPASDDMRRNLFRAAEVLGAANMKIGPDTSGPPVDTSRFAERFDALATEASEHGTRVALEFLPFAAHMDALEPAIELVTQVGNPAGGLCLDIWHVARVGTDYSVISSSLPGEYLFVVELNDAAAERIGSFAEDTMHRRLLPGDGAFDVPAFIGEVRATGFDGPWGVEMLSDRHRGLPLAQALDEAKAATLACFAEADRRLS